MLKVIDFNVLASNPRPLTAFFAESPDNRGVLTDTMGIECLKRSGIVNYRKSFGLLLDYADRVLILKPMADLWRLKPQQKGFYELIVDQDLSLSFPQYCREVVASSNPASIASILAEQAKVDPLMLKLTKIADEELRGAITEIQAAIPSGVRSNWKSSNPVSSEELEQFSRQANAVTTHQFMKAFPGMPLPQREDALYWVPYRYTVALQALTLKWIRDGGHLNTKADKLRNDSMDIFYVAYGTLFDGVLSSDVRLQDISILSNAILKHAAISGKRH